MINKDSIQVSEVLADLGLPEKKAIFRQISNEQKSDHLLHLLKKLASPQHHHHITQLDSGGIRLLKQYVFNSLLSDKSLAYIKKKDEHLYNEKKLHKHYIIAELLYANGYCTSCEQLLNTIHKKAVEGEFIELEKNVLNLKKNFYLRLNEMEKATEYMQRNENVSHRLHIINNVDVISRMLIHYQRIPGFDALPTAIDSLQIITPLKVKNQNHYTFYKNLLTSIIFQHNRDHKESLLLLIKVFKKLYVKSKKINNEFASMLLVKMLESFIINEKHIYAVKLIDKICKLEIITNAYQIEVFLNACSLYLINNEPKKAKKYVLQLFKLVEHRPNSELSTKATYLHTVQLFCTQKYKAVFEFIAQNHRLIKKNKNLECEIRFLEIIMYYQTGKYFMVDFRLETLRKFIQNQKENLCYTLYRKFLLSFENYHRVRLSKNKIPGKYLKQLTEYQTSNMHSVWQIYQPGSFVIAEWLVDKIKNH